MNYLNFLQKLNDKLYTHFGLNSLTLELQTKINTKRNEIDILDENEVVNFDNNGEYKQ